jgi:hypothetical protein
LRFVCFNCDCLTGIREAIGGGCKAYINGDCVLIIGAGTFDEEADAEGEDAEGEDAEGEGEDEIREGEDAEGEDAEGEDAEEVGR